MRTALAEAERLDAVEAITLHQSEARNTYMLVLVCINIM